MRENQSFDPSKEAHHSRLKVVRSALAFNQCGMATKVSAQLGFNNVSLGERNNWTELLAKHEQ